MNGIGDKIIRRVRKKIQKNVKKNEKPVRWGIIGTGYMAETFGTAIDGNPNGIVVGVASRTLDNAKRFAVRHGGCKAYENDDELVSDKQVDVIYVAIPTKYHYEKVKKCLEAGKNVLCEKPITCDAKELEELIKIAKKNSCFLMEGMWTKCLPTYQKAREWISEGKIGDLELIKVDFYKREKIDTTKAIFNKEEGGGVLQDYGVYAISFPVEFLQKNIERIENFSRMSSYEIDSDWMIYLQSGKVQVFINLSSNFQGVSKAAIIGNKGAIEWNEPFNRTNVITLYDATGKKIEQFKANYKFEGFEYEINEVQSCIKNGIKESMLVTLDSSLRVQNIMDRLLMQ